VTYYDPFTDATITPSRRCYGSSDAFVTHRHVSPQWDGNAWDVVVFGVVVDQRVTRHAAERSLAELANELQWAVALDATERRLALAIRAACVVPVVIGFTETAIIATLDGDALTLDRWSDEGDVAMIERVRAKVSRLAMTQWYQRKAG
jgi:hypothetical protein